MSQRPESLPPESRRTGGDGAAGGDAAVVPRDSATVMLLRDVAGGVEVYLMRRLRAMPFAGGMTAYPGGSVDPGDVVGDQAWSGPPAAAWATQLGTTEERARALLGAAVRETFEETGVLLASPRRREPPGATGAEWEEDRQRLAARGVTLQRLLEQRHLVLRTDLLRPWARWVTPELEPRRYDTRFFVAAIPAGQRARDVSGEADSAQWSRPSRALAQWEAGQRPMLPPTVRTLQQLLPYPDVAAVLAAAPPAGLAPVLPRVVTEDGVQWVLLADGQRIRPPVRLGRPAAEGAP